MLQQVPIQFNHLQEQTFEQFVFGTNSRLQSLLNDSTQKNIYIWGESFLGKTHLLSALYHQYLAENKSAVYIPLSLKSEISIDMLDNIQKSELVCIDDIDEIAGDRVWEEALFNLYNQMRELNHKLVVTAQCNATNTDFVLKDLKSRLQWGITFKLNSLSDTDKIELLKQRAEIKGFDLTQDVANYLLTRISRNLPELIQLLDKFDYASLVEQRKLTIPFIKKHISP